MNNANWKTLRLRVLEKEKAHVAGAGKILQQKIDRLEITVLVAQLLKDYEGYRDSNEAIHVRVNDDVGFSSEGSISSTLSINTSRKLEGLYDQLNRSSNAGDVFKSVNLDEEDFTRVSFSPDGRYLIRRVSPFNLHNSNSAKHRENNPGELDYIKIPETFIYYRLVVDSELPKCFVTRGPGFTDRDKANIKHPHIFERTGRVEKLCRNEHYSQLYVQDFCTGNQMSISSNTHGMLISGMTASIFGDVLEAIYRTHNPQSPANTLAFLKSMHEDHDGDDDDYDYDEEE